MMLHLCKDHNNIKQENVIHFNGISTFLSETCFCCESESHHMT